MNLQPNSACPVYYWQHMGVYRTFVYREDVVTFISFLQWVRAVFNKFVKSARKFTVKVYYLSDRESWEERVKIDDDTKLRSRLALVSTDETVQSYIVVSIEDASPTKPPCDDDVSVNKSSVISALSSQSRSIGQANFRQRVLKRDSQQCVFCDVRVTAHLQAAHIIDVFRAVGGESLEQYGLHDMYDTQNGLTLCGECHLVFDAKLCCVKVEVDSQGAATDHTILVANALKLDRSFSAKWSRLDGAKVRVPHDQAGWIRWPPAAVFQFRKNIYDEKTAERHQEAADKPYQCECGNRTKTAGGLVKHINSKRCMERTTTVSNRLSTLCTPVAESPVAKSKSNHRRKRSPPNGKKLFPPDDDDGGGKAV